MISGSGSCDAGPIGKIAPDWVTFTDERHRPDNPFADVRNRDKQRSRDRVLSMISAVRWRRTWSVSALSRT
jgi:hypothetical protein